MRKNKIIIFFLLTVFSFIYLLLFGNNANAATTIRFNSQSGTGYMGVWAGATGTWDEIHDASYGNQGVGTDLLQVSTGKSGTPANNVIKRSFLVFNTSDLPDNVEIESAELSLTVQSYRQSYANDGYDYIGLVKTSQDNFFSLTENDYDQCGAVDNPILGNENKPDYTDINIGDTVSIAFNQTGLGWIDKGGITAVGLREGHDIEDYDPGYLAYTKNSVYFYSHEAENINFRPYLEVTYTLPDEPRTNPVIIIPGIMGSWEKNGQWVLDPILHTYDDLWQALSLAGYQEGLNLFSAPYEWRYSNTISASILENKIQEAKNASQSGKVDIIAHSMGGLVAREYIESSDYGSSNVDKLIFLAAPHQGAPEAYLAWEGGEMGIGLKNKLMKKLFEQEAHFYNFKDLFSYVREFPVASIGELLPTFDYLKDAASGNLRIYPDNYPANNFLGLLNNPERMVKLNAVDITNIYANSGSYETLNMIRVVDNDYKDGRWEHGYPEHYLLPLTDHGLIMGPGDGTVPFASNAMFFPGNNLELQSTHNGIVSDAQEEVIEILTGIEPVNRTIGVPINEILLVRVCSPVDILVISPSGEKLGKDFAGTGEFNEIANGFYSGFDAKVEFISIPNPENGIYTIKVQGTEAGLYKIGVDVLSDNSLPEPESIFVPGISSQGKIENFTVDIAQDNGEQPKLIKQIDFAGLMLDLEELYNQGEILKRQAFNLLSARLASLEKIYEKMSEKKPVWQIKIQNKIILVNLRLIKAKLNFYKNRQWITEDALDVLNYDLDGIIQGL